MYIVLVNNGSEEWVAKTCRTFLSAVKTAERIRNEVLSAVSVRVERVK